MGPAADRAPGDRGGHRGSAPAVPPGVEYPCATAKTRSPTVRSATTITGRISERTHDGTDPGRDSGLDRSGTAPRPCPPTPNHTSSPRFLPRPVVADSVARLGAGERVGQYRMGSGWRLREELAPHARLDQPPCGGAGRRLSANYLKQSGRLRRRPERRFHVRLRPVRGHLTASFCARRYVQGQHPLVDPRARSRRGRPVRRGAGRRSTA